MTCTDTMMHTVMSSFRPMQHHTRERALLHRDGRVSHWAGSAARGSASRQSAHFHVGKPIALFS
jgi:hypothetical protein